MATMRGNIYPESEREREEREGMGQAQSTCDLHGAREWERDVDDRRAFLKSKPYWKIEKESSPKLLSGCLLVRSGYFQHRGIKLSWIGKGDTSLIYVLSKSML